MKKLISLCLVSCVVAMSAAFALDMTPEQAMEKMANCMCCKSFGENPQIGQNIRYDIFETKNGYVSTFVVADESLAAEFKKVGQQCEVKFKEAMTLSAEEADKKLCPFCVGTKELMSRGDIQMENFPTTLGMVTVATSSVPEGIEALHGFAQMARETSELLAQAARAGEHAGHDH